MAVVEIEGKQITLPDDIVKAGDGAIRAMLASNGFPAVENADIKIIGGKQGAPAIVKVAPRSTGKGGPDLDAIATKEIDAAQMLANALAEAYGVAAPTDAWTRHRRRLVLRFGLSDREANVAIESLKGHKNSVVANRFDLSIETVNKHLDRIYAKAHVTSRAELAAWLLGQV